MVRFVLTRDQVEATIRCFACIHNVIAASPRLEKTMATVPPYVTPEDSNRWALGEFNGNEKTELMVREQRTIALSPRTAADSLLSPGAHSVYLRWRFRRACLM